MSLTGKSLSILRAQPVDEHVHHVGLRIEREIPDVFEDHGLGHGPAGVAQKEFQQREFLGLEFDGPRSGRA